MIRTILGAALAGIWGALLKGLFSRWYGEPGFYGRLWLLNCAMASIAVSGVHSVRPLSQLVVLLPLVGTALGTVCTAVFWFVLSVGGDE